MAEETGEKQITLPKEVVETKEVSYHKAKQLMKEAKEREKGKYVLSEKQKANLEKLLAFNKERRANKTRAIEQEKKKADDKAEQVRQSTITVKIKPRKTIKKTVVVESEEEDDEESVEEQPKKVMRKKREPKEEVIQKKIDIVNRIDNIINQRRSQYDMMRDIMKQHF